MTLFIDAQNDLAPMCFFGLAGGQGRAPLATLRTESVCTHLKSSTEHTLLRCALPCRVTLAARALAVCLSRAI